MMTYLDRARVAGVLLGLVVLPAAIVRADDDVQALKLQVEDLSEKVAQLSAKDVAATNGGALRLIDTSVDVLMSAGTSSEDKEGIESLQGGGHDPKRSGFTLQQAELALSGVVDPYFAGQMAVVFLEDEIELEEAFGTAKIGDGLELKAGQYLTEFGRINPSHPHSWAWVDQPVVNSRMLGGDGSRAPGARIAWLTPLPWYSQVILGVQNPDNETMASFLGEAAHSHGDEEEHTEEEGEDHEHEYEETIGGYPRVDRDVEDIDDLLYSARWENSADLNDETSALLGFSAMTGPNAAGEDTQTMLYGVDLTMKWKPVNNRRGFPALTWQSEAIFRDCEADDAEIEHDGEMELIEGDTLSDWGFYTQLLYGFDPRWAAGLRLDYATGDGEGAEGRDEDNLRDDRLRISPLVAYKPSEFSRVRLQYNYDDADHLEDGDAHSVWLALEFLFGKHPAHAY